MRIDVHTHILPESWPDWTARSGYPGWIRLEQVRSAPGGCACARMLQTEPGGKDRFFREIQANCWDPEVRIREIDQVMGPGSRQVLSTVPVMFSYWARPQDAYDLAQLLNDHIAGACAAHPDRFWGLATLPMQTPELAVKELERCVKDLRLPGIQIGSNVNGLNLDDPSIVEVLTAAAGLGACVFVHPWDMLAEPGIPADRNLHPAPHRMHPRLTRHWANWLAGMPFETALAVQSVLFGGVLEKLPKLRIGFAHAGGAFPGTVGRFEHGFAARPDLCQTQTKTPPRQQVPGLYFDSLTHDPDCLRSLIKLAGPDHIMLGSDYPFPLGEDRPGEMIASMPDLDAACREKLFSRTALEFLGRPLA